MNDELLRHYFRLMTMNGGVRVFHTARELGILGQLGPEPQTSVAIAEACKCDQRACVLLLNVLVELGVAAKSESGYQAGELLGLLTGPYASLSDRYWDHLGEYLKTGKPLEQMDDPKQGAAHYVQQVTSLDWMMREAAKAAVPVLSPLVPDGGHVLDIGAGSGVWSLTLAAVRADVQVQALDRPEVLAIASQQAEKAGLSNQFATCAGDLFQVQVDDASADLAIVANVCHGLQPLAIQALLGKISQWLKPGGAVAIVDVLEVSPEAGLTASLYEMGLALRTDHGTVHDVSLLKEMVVEAGFHPEDALALEAPPAMMGVLVAKK